MKHNIHFLRYLISVLIISCPFSIFSQSHKQAIENTILNDLESARNERGIGFEYSFDPSNEKYFLDYLRKLDHDTSLQVRVRVQFIKSIIGIQSRNVLIRQQVIEDFLNDYLDPDPRDPDQELKYSALNRLNYFTEPDFSDKARRIMKIAFKYKGFNSEFVIICGTAQVKELIPQIKKIAANFDGNRNTNYGNEWYASLALARLGDSEKVADIIAAVELNPDLRRRTGSLLRWVAYTRQPACIRLLQKYLESPETVPMERTYGFPVKKYAIEYLARYVVGFPIKAEGIGYPYSTEDFEIAKAYLIKINSLK